MYDGAGIKKSKKDHFAIKSKLISLSIMGKRKFKKDHFAVKSKLSISVSFWLMESKKEHFAKYNERVGGASGACGGRNAFVGEGYFLLQ